MRGSRGILMVLFLAGKAAAQDAAVQSVLQANCASCHNDSTKASGLSLSGRESIMAGGNRGPAVKVGNPSESLLFQAVAQSGNLKMPPGRKLSAEGIETIRKWIADGASWT